MKSAEEKVSQYYNTVGWKTDGQHTEDANRFEDLRACAAEYVSKCRLRVLNYIPETGEKILDMASGPIQYNEYLEYSRNYERRYCVDLSSMALEAAKKKIGEHGIFLCGSFFDIDLPENFFDCTISLHTIYHIDKEKQEEAVRKLIRVTKSGKPVIIVYGNPKTYISYLKSFLRLFKFNRITRRLKRFVKRQEGNAKESDLYYFLHPIKWWHRFSDVAEIKILPWRSFSSADQKKLIPNTKQGKKIFDILYSLEERFPRFFARHFQYPMIILKKKDSL